MNSDEQPDKVPLTWAASAAAPYVNEIPVASQIGLVNGAASWTDGYPPLNFIPINAGGYPPRGADTNGVLRTITAGLQWLEAGGLFPFDADFADTIGGYPYGAVVPSTLYRGLLWTSLVDGNLTDPDAGSATWLPFNRWRLTSNTTFYVNGSTGLDTNNGLAPSGTAPSGPFKTIARAAYVLSNFVDLSGFVASIRLASGTFANDPIYMAGRIPGASLGTFSVIWQAIDGPVTLVTTNQVAAVIGNAGAAFKLEGVFNLSSPVGVGSLVAAVSVEQAQVTFDGDFSYPGSRDANIYAGPNAFIDYAVGSTEIVGPSSSCPRHWLSLYGLINFSLPGNLSLTLSGTNDFSAAFAQASNLGWIQADGLTIAGGSATGARYLAAGNGLITTGGGGASFFPGSIAGSTSSGGQYT